MYDSFGAIWRGFSKNLGPAFRYRTNLAGFLLFHLTIGVLPFGALAAAALNGGSLAGPMVAVLGVFVMRGAQAVRFRYPIWSAGLHPLAVMMMAMLAVVSRFRYETRGVEWKERRYRPIQPPPKGRHAAASADRAGRKTL
jgi:hypothetical protein